MAHVTDFKEAGFNTLLEELEWRGLISQSTDRDRLAEALNGEHVFPVSKPGDRVIDAAQAAGLFKSASEARRAIKSGGVYLNNNRIEDEEQVLAEADFLAGRFALIRRGKKALGAVENR